MRKILICGAKNSGKDHAAYHIQNTLFNGSTSKVCIFGTSDPVKRCLYDFIESGAKTNLIWGSSIDREGPLNGFKYPFSNEIIFDNVEGKGRKWCNILFNSVFIDAMTKLRSWANNEIISKENPPTVRRLLQTLATDWAMSVDNTVWARQMINSLIMIENGYHYTNRLGACPAKKNKEPEVVIVTGGRFEMEIKSIREYSGEVWLIERPDFIVKENDRNTHLAETNIGTVDKSLFDKIIINDGNIENFEEKVRNTYNDYQ